MKLRALRNFGLWILCTYLVCLLIFCFVFWRNGASIIDIKENFLYIATEILSAPVAWIFLTIPYMIYRLFRYLFLSWKNHSSMIFLKRFSFSIILPVLFIFSGISFSNWYTQSEAFEYTWDHSYNNEMDTVLNRYAKDGKQRGMHLFSRQTLDEQALEELLQTNLEWLTLVPFTGQKDYDSEQVGRRSGDYTNRTRRDSFFIAKINTLKSHGFYIMIKPHIWMHSPSDGKWRSDISPKSEEAWKKWSESYRKFILHYAEISEETQVELFCIGTELHKLVKERPEFWEQLIKDIRKIYSGKITYAANWNAEMHDVTFWDQLDYIGIQAYFPLTDKTEPNVRTLKKGWKQYINEIEALHQKYNKPILFSELGYKSTPDAAIEPWAWANAVNSLYKKASYKTQANCYEAFFQTFWNKEWFAGVHFWEWQASHKRHSDKKNINFTPQQKPAENIMTKWFGKTPK